jgi:hypothetical protein
MLASEKPPWRRVFTARELQEMLDEQRDVLDALPQRRQSDWEHAEPEVEVLAQRFVGNRLARIAVRGGDQARVDALFLLAADGQDHALLQNAQEMRLQLDRHLR